MKKCTAFTRIIVACLIFILPAQILHISASLPGKNLFVSWLMEDTGDPCTETHHCSFNDALAQANDGDSIYLPAGNKYTNLLITKSINLFGGWDGNLPTLDGKVHRDPKTFVTRLSGEGICQVIRIQGEDINNIIYPTIDGFTITNSSPEGIVSSESFTTETITSGCGIYAENANPTISHNIFKNIQGTSILELVNSSGTIDGNLFIDNLPVSDTDPLSIIFIKSTTLQTQQVRIQNNILAGETILDITGIKMDAGSSGLPPVLAVYNTLVSFSTAVDLPDTVNADIGYNIFANNTTGIRSTASTNLIGEYNLYYENSDDFAAEHANVTNPVSGDPRFVDPENNDYHIQLDSAARNKGTCIATVTEDIDRQPRPVYGKCDLGADQIMGIFLPFITRF